MRRTLPRYVERSVGRRLFDFCRARAARTVSPSLEKKMPSRRTPRGVDVGERDSNGLALAANLSGFPLHLYAARALFPPAPEPTPSHRRLSYRPAAAPRRSLSFHPPCERSNQPPPMFSWVPTSSPARLSVASRKAGAVPVLQLLLGQCVSRTCGRLSRHCSSTAM